MQHDRTVTQCEQRWPLQMILEEFGKQNTNGTDVRDQYYSAILSAVAQVPCKQP